jgi:hypothetical protein
MNTIDNTLHLVSDVTRTFDVDGEAVPVREWEVRGLITEREFLPIFERRGKGPVLCVDEEGKSVLSIEKSRRVILPSFRYDINTATVVGEEDAGPTTLDDRMVAVIRATRANGFGEVPADRIREVEQYVHIHLLLAGYDAHIMAGLPGFDEMDFYFMVRSNLVRA